VADKFRTWRKQSYNFCIKETCHLVLNLSIFVLSKEKK
jgi:hypothetical protein